MAHDFDKLFLEAGGRLLAERTGGFGARQLRAALDSTPLVRVRGMWRTP